MTPHSQPATNALDADCVRATTISKGARLIHARNHKSKSGNARTVRRADPATSDASPAEGIAACSARAIEGRDDERIAALFVMPRVYQQRKAVDTLDRDDLWKRHDRDSGTQKIFSGTDLGTRSITLFQLQNHKKRHCQSDKIRLFDSHAADSLLCRSV